MVYLHYSNQITTFLNEFRDAEKHEFSVLSSSRSSSNEGSTRRSNNIAFRIQDRMRSTERHRVCLLISRRCREVRRNMPNDPL
jgi:hypothetical protein